MFVLRTVGLEIVSLFVCEPGARVHVCRESNSLNQRTNPLVDVMVLTWPVLTFQ